MNAASPALLTTARISHAACRQLWVIWETYTTALTASEQGSKANHLEQQEYLCSHFPSTQGVEALRKHPQNTGSRCPTLSQSVSLYTQKLAWAL